MPKTKSIYICQNCGTQSPKWVGKCGSCNEWNTYVQEVVHKEKAIKGPVSTATLNEPVLLDNIDILETYRIRSTDEELNRVLGGGVVPGSVVLIAGEPGIGKSTLLLQVAMGFGEAKVIYISGEESAQQISLRAKRLGLSASNCYIVTETATDKLLKHMKALQPALVIVDSIQTLRSPYIESTPGSVSQIRECTGEMQRFAKEAGVPVFLIGHITKEGSIAGPKILEHIVDTVLQFEGERKGNYRILRTSKNRYGSTSELGIYEMRNNGLREVSNPSELLISQREEQLSGIAIAATIEGMRPMLIETQALVTQAVYGTPQRSATGFDIRRLNMLLAVLEKRGGFQFGTKDVFLNIAGGLRVEDPAIDLSIICTLLSSYEDICVPANYAFAGEVGLSGEVRAVSRVEQRISEAEKLGFEKIFVPGYGLKSMDLKAHKIIIEPINKVSELYNKLF